MDERFEVNEQEQNPTINNVEHNIPEPKNESKSTKMNEESILSGVSIESASYMEQSNDNTLIVEDKNNNIDFDISTNNDEEYTPKLFSEDAQSQLSNDAQSQLSNEGGETEINHSEKLFDQDINEDEDFEIPAFLRKQKF